MEKREYVRIENAACACVCVPFGLRHGHEKEFVAQCILDHRRMGMEYVGSFGMHLIFSKNPASSMAMLDVSNERERQVRKGYTAEHDDKHLEWQLSRAGACYAVRADNFWLLESPPGWWPFDLDRWKPKSIRENLVRAAALIIAEIERLDRAGES